MGTSTRSIPFIDSSVLINVHSATNASDIRVMSIEEFAEGWGIVSVEEIIETGELIVTRLDGDFIQGPEAFPPIY